MNRVCLKTISEITQKSFTIENISMKRSQVTPPDPFKCKKGHLEKNRFFYIIGGVFTAKRSDGEKIIAKAGEIVYLPSDVEYESEWSGGDSEYITLECNFLSLDRNDYVLADNMYVICRDKTEKYLKNMVKMYEYFTRNSTISEFRMISLIYNFISDIISDNEKAMLKNEDIISPIYRGIKYIDDNYCTDISVKEIADLCNVSESTFRRKFLLHFGITPREYVDKLKIQKAKELLSSGLYNVNEVANFLNFYDTSHFNKFFKTRCGVNPKSYIPD